MSQHAMETYTSRQTNDLLAQAQEIMAQAERDGVDPDERLREVVGQAIRDGFAFGANSQAEEGPVDGEHKRTRAE